MPIEKDQFLKHFPQQVLDARTSLFLGAGASCGAGYPNWNHLFAEFAEELYVKPNDSTDLVLECLSEIARYLGEATPYHYMIMINDPSDQYFKYFIDDMERRYHIRVLLVDDYSEIPDILNELNEKIRSKRVFISGAYHSLTNEIDKCIRCGADLPCRKHAVKAIHDRGKIYFPRRNDT